MRKGLCRFGKKVLPPVLVLLAYGLAAFLCSRSLQGGKVFGSTSQSGIYYARAEVLATDNRQVRTTQYAGLYTGVQVASIHMDTGPYAGRRYSISNVLNDEINYYLTPGEKVTVSVNLAAGTAQAPDIALYAPYRTSGLLVLTVIFLAVFCLVGKWKGVRSIVGLILTVITLFFIFMPLLLEGVPTLPATVLAVFAIAFSTTFLVTGWTRKSAASILGILAGICISSLLLECATGLLHLSGYTMTDTYALLNLARQSKLQIPFLLFSEITLASLGAVMDISISISTSVYEISQHNPETTFSSLFRSGMHVGQDIMGTMVNTLLLAFIGASLSTFLLFYAGPFRAGQLLNSDAVAAQILQILCGGLAIAVTVPTVSAISAKLMPGID